jgi:hypothetical protein
MSFSRYFRRRSLVRLLIFSMVAYIFYISLVGFGKMDNYSDEESNDNVNLEYNQNNNNNNNQFLPHQINNVKKRNDIEVNNQINNQAIAQPDNNGNINQILDENSEKMRKILTIIDKYDNSKDYLNIKDNGMLFF